MSERLHVGRPPDVVVVKGELLASLDGLLSVLRAIAAGDLTPHLEVPYPDSHPVGALALSINEMVSALREAQARSANYSQELKEKIETIERQHAAIQELSMPIIEIWTGVLCVPIIGVLDSSRAAEMTGTLLNAIVEKRAPLAILDITGIDVMDTRTADHFIRMARSVRLLGARCALSGVRPNIARMIVQMGIDLSGIDSYRSMREALRSYVESVRGKTTPAQPTPAQPKEKAQ
jgi:rsbT co-antagonist protein RsbR